MLSWKVKKKATQNATLLDREAPKYMWLIYSRNSRRRILQTLGFNLCWPFGLHTAESPDCLYLRPLFSTEEQTGGILGH